MTLTTAASLTAKEALSPLSELDIQWNDNETFKDNIEHLETLEYLARLTLARAYLLGGNSLIQAGRRRASIRFRKPRTERDEPDLSFISTPTEEVTPDRIDGLLKSLESDIQKRVRKSLDQGVELHFEEFCRSFGLDNFEQTVLTLMIANTTGKAFRDFYEKSLIDPHERQDGGMSIGAILSIIHPEYRDQITSRRYFSMESPLIRQEILVPWGNYDKTTNILDVRVYLHERIVRYVLGDNNIYDVDFQCISRDRGTADLSRVILPGTIKEKVMELAQSYASPQSKEARTLVNQFFGYGTGLVFLFHGPSGTGKTMLAHALATCLKKELLSVNMEYVSNMFGSSEELIKYVFKEAKLSDAIVFFDECDEMFHANSRDSRTLLVEIEKAECIVIMATNRVVELDPAMDRRITMKVPFFLPDEAHRERIWKALVPPNVSLENDVDFKSLAKKYLITGGLIKNAIFTAVTKALSKNGHAKVVLTADEIEEAAEYQSASMFDLFSLGKTYVPEISIEGLSLRPHDKTRLQELAKVFSRLNSESANLRLLVGCSDIGTGIRVAEAVARECGLKVREFPLVDLFVGQNSTDKITDPITRRQISFLDYVFRPVTGLRTLTLLVDHDSLFEHLFLGSASNEVRGKDLLGFYARLRQSHGLVFLLTTPIKLHSLPIEFSTYFEVHPPPEELQLRKWEEHLGDGKETRERVVEIVEQYPLHLNEISRVVQTAKTTAYLNGNETITLEHVHEVLKRLKNQERMPVLFGKNNACGLYPDEM